MAKVAALTFLLLLLVYSSSAAAPEESPSAEESPSPAESKNSGGGLDETCKKTTNPTFCGLFLRPYASVFASNDPKKIGFTAVNATLGQVKSTKSFMLREAMNDKTTSKDVHATMMTCVSRIARGEGNLKLAARAYDTPELSKIEPEKMLDGATNELNACLDVLNKTTGGAGDSDDSTDVAFTASRKVKDSIIACSVAKSIVT